MFDEEGYTRPNVHASDHSTAVGRDFYKNCDMRTVAPRFCNACRKRYVHEYEHVCPQCAQLRAEAQGQALIVFAIFGWMMSVFVVIQIAAFFSLQPTLSDLFFYGIALEGIAAAAYIYFGPKVSAWINSFSRRLA